MDRQLRVLQITRYLQTLAGLAPKIVKVDGYWLILACPICQKEYKREISMLYWTSNQTTSNLGLTCSKSCMVRRRFTLHPEAFQAAGLKQKGVARVGRHGRGVPRGPLSQAHRDAVSETLRKMEWAPTVRKGNGTGLTPAEAVIHPTMLELGFEWNCAVSLGERQPGYPTNYKLDFGHRQHLVGVEIDGHTHRTVVGQTRDRKKEERLAELGWSMFRIPNERLLPLSGIFTSRDAMTILPPEFWSIIAKH